MIKHLNYFNILLKYPSKLLITSKVQILRSIRIQNEKKLLSKIRNKRGRNQREKTKQKFFDLSSPSILRRILRPYHNRSSSSPSRAQYQLSEHRLPHRSVALCRGRQRRALTIMRFILLEDDRDLLLRRLDLRRWRLASLKLGAIRRKSLGGRKLGFSFLHRRWRCRHRLHCWTSRNQLRRCSGRACWGCSSSSRGGGSLPLAAA